MTDANHVDNLSTFRLRRRTPGSFLLVPCPKQGRSIRCQGQLEAAAAVILAACPQVAHIKEQPLTIWYTWRGADGPVHIELLDGPPTAPRRREKDAGTSYIVPDFLVDMADRSKRLVEVKPSSRLERPITQRKLAVAHLSAAAQGWTFHVVTEKQLEPSPLLANTRLIGRYRQAHTDEGLLAELTSHVAKQGIPLGELCQFRTDVDSMLVRVHVLHLLASGQLSFDPLSKPLDNQTLIYPKGVITWDPFDSVWAPSGCWTSGPGVWSANSPPIGSSPKTSSSL